jgi:hypothetical protein
MTFSKTLCAAIVASTLATVTLASAASASESGQVVRAERSSNPKDVFVRTVKAPAAKRDRAAAAHDCPCPMMSSGPADRASPSQPPAR